MNQLMTVQTMTSLEIAELTGSTHDNVLKTIRKLIVEGVVFGNETPYVNQQNKQTYPQYLLDFRNTMVVISGYNAELRARIIDRWQELEAQQAPAFAIPSTLSGALMLAAKQAEQIEAQQAQLALAAPKVAFVQNYVAANTGSKGFREVCKLLNVKEPVFREFLKEQGVMYRLGGAWTPAAPHLALGRFEVKTGVNTGTGHAFTHALFTPKGVEWIAGVWARHCVKQACGVAA